MASRTKRFYEFGPFRVDANERILQRDGRPISLTPKAFDTLLILVVNSGHIVEKDELMRSVWPDSFVEEGNLTRNIFTLRRVLGETSNGEQYIETIPKRGYRFAASVKDFWVEGAEAAKEQTTPTPEQIVQNKHQGLSAKRAMLIVLTTLLAAVIAVFIYLKHVTQASGLTDKDTVLIADFTNQTGDEIFEGPLKQALAVQLEQSPFLNIFPDDRVRETLRMMGRPADERVTRDIAREVCERQGLKAMLMGSIAPIGSHYIIGLEAINAHNGDVIAREQIEAESKEQVMSSLGKAASKFRSKLGESLSSIQKFDAPIEQATTSSLDAFKAFSLGDAKRKTGQELEAIPFFRRAIELDPAFALAYLQMSVVYWNSGQRELASEFAIKAFELRDRVSAREKFGISSIYYGNATGEVDKDIEVLELWKQTYPRDHPPHIDLAVDYGLIGQFEKSVEEAREAIQLNPHESTAYINLGHAFICLNHLDEAKQVYEQALTQKLDGMPFHTELYGIAFVQEDTATMKQQIEWAIGKPNEYVALNWQANTAAFVGRLRQAREFSRRAVDLAQNHNAKEVAARFAVLGTQREALFGNCEQARKNIANALALARNSLSLQNGAVTLAMCGEVGEAQSLVDELGKRYPKDTLIEDIWLPTIRAALELQRGNASHVIELLQPTLRYDAALFWPRYMRGLAYLKLKQSAEAATQFQSILDHRGQAPLSPLYPLAHLGVARAAALAGDTDKSRKSYQVLFVLWKDADPDIPILQEAKSEYQRLK